MSTNKSAAQSLVPVENMAQEIVEVVQAQELRRAVSVSIVVTPVAPYTGHPVSRAVTWILASPWMPWHVLHLIDKGHWTTYRETAATYPGLMKTVMTIALTTALADSLWHRATIPISALGGILTFAVIALRTGLLYDLLDALGDLNGRPHLGVVLWFTIRAFPIRLRADMQTIYTHLEAIALHQPSPSRHRWRRRVSCAEVKADREDEGVVR